VNDPEVSYLVPIQEAESIAAIALREVDRSLITPEVCEWAITEAMRGVSLLTIRTQALEAQAIALSQRVDKVEDKLQEQQQEISMLKAGQYAQDKIMTFLQGQTQQAQTLALDSAKESKNKHLWVHDPSGMILGLGCLLLIIPIVIGAISSITVVRQVPTQTNAHQEVRP